ncbi:MAG: thioredoxin family protein [Planctomycetota bacterium]
MSHLFSRWFVALLITGPLVAQRHPHFDDGGTLAWQTTFAAAKEAAAKADKLIFVQYGRAACGNCRVLVTEVLTNSAIKQRLGEVAIGYAVDCDQPDSDIRDMLLSKIPDAKMLPFIAFLTPTGEWVNGASGFQEVAAMAGLVKEAAATPLMDAKPEVRAALAKAAAAATPAADKGDWKAVLAAARVAKQSTGRCPERVAIAAAEQKARDYAEAEFAAVLEAANAGGDLASLRKRLTTLKAPFAGEPEAADCDLGLKALPKLQFVRDVESRGNPAKDLRPKTAEAFKGSRWTALFVPPAAPAEAKPAPEQPKEPDQPREKG